MDEKKLLMTLLRNQVCGCKHQLAHMPAEQLEKLYALAKRHDLAHIAGQELATQKLLGDDEISQKLKDSAKQAVYRYVLLSHELGQICRVLESASIAFIPLKGSVLRDMYPTPWMRTSCDIDILVHESILEQATQLLAEKLEYTIGEKWGHDRSLYSPSGVHLELHYAVIEDTQVVGSQVVLDHFWDSATPCAGYQFHHRVSDEMFYFFHIAHMAKHVHSGGCGIRPFLDLWILNHKVEHSKENRNALLREGGLLDFAIAAEKLSERWFSEQHDDDAYTDLFESYILDGGVYGTLKNSVFMRRANTHGVQYILSRIFVNKDFLTLMFPVLEKHPWLEPFCQVARWIKLLFDGRFRVAACELQVNANISQAETQAIQTLQKYLGMETDSNQRSGSQ